MQYVWDLEAEVKHLRKQVREFGAPQRRLNWVLFGIGVLSGAGVMLVARLI